MKVKITNNPLLKSKLKHTAAIVALSVIINMAGALLVTVTGVPLYIDTVGTMLAAVLGGYIPGIAVGFITSIIKWLAVDADEIFFMTLNVVIALAASYLAGRGFFRNIKNTYAFVPIIAPVAGILRTAAALSLYGAALYSRSNGLYLQLNGIIHNFFASHFIAAIIIEFIDKALVVTLFLIIQHFIPRKSFVPGGVWQAPLDDELKNSIREQKNRIISLRTKILLILIVASMFTTLFSVVISSTIFKNTTIKDSERFADGIAGLAADTIDAEMIDEYIEKGEQAQGYKETEEMLYKIRNASPDIEYVYVYKIMDDGCHVVFDLDTDELEGSAPGDVVEFDESFYLYIDDLLKGEEIEPLISDDSFGWLLTVYKPIYDKNGICRAYAAADVSMQKLTNYGYSFLAKLLSILIGCLILILAVGVWLVENNIILPVNTMSFCAMAFAYDNDEVIEKNVKRAKELRIHTGDEIERLYNAFVKTISDSLDYIDDIQNKTDTISKMQNGLIMVLADMVENRDKCTGDHVQKTVAYVKAILEQMQRRGMYADTIDEQFIIDVINAAPLHDIGKIHISDTILNKPGKLTDEEFEIMKQHTVYGSEIIEKAISIVPESGYLKEAKNVALYHHEKWNGKGYPRGLSGEDIPLSARVMAVADVFDALVSQRSYKKPFTFEKALSIIKEDAGTHFDPVVAEAFLEIEDKIREIAQEQNKTD